MIAAPSSHACACVLPQQGCDVPADSRPVARRLTRAAWALGPNTRGGAIGALQRSRLSRMAACGHTRACLQNRALTEHARVNTDEI